MGKKKGNQLAFLVYIVVAVIVTSIGIGFLPEAASRFKQLIFFLGIPAVTVAEMAIGHLIGKIRKKNGR